MDVKFKKRLPYYLLLLFMNIFIIPAYLPHCKEIEFYHARRDVT